MKISVVNGFKLEILQDSTIIYNQKIDHDQMGTILNEKLPPLRKIKQLYLWIGPGSLVGARSLMAYSLGLTTHHNIEIFYIDIIRDWYLKKWPHHHIIFPFTNKKLLVGYEENGHYKHYFLENLNDLPDLYWLDHSIKNFNFIYDDTKIIEWTGKDLYDCQLHQNLSSIVEYKIW